MGKVDTNLYTYLSDKSRFADLFNGGLFGGRQIIDPKDLTSILGRYIQSGQLTGENCNPQNFGSDRSRDLIMQYKSQAVLRLLAVENQTEVDYTMPWRCMNYDAREYEKQIRQLGLENRRLKKLEGDAEFLCGLKKEDRLIPVYTLCVYYGEEIWDGPRSLKDMMDFGQTPLELDRWFCDYSMNLICVNEWQGEEMFRTSLRQIFAALPHRKNKKKLREVMERDPAYRQLDGETYRALAVLLGEKGLAAQSEKEERKEWDMCKALEDIRQEGFEEGIERGRELGVDQGKLIVVRNMLRRGMKPEDIMALAECSRALVESVQGDVI